VQLNPGRHKCFEESETETESDTETDTESDTETDTESDTETDTESDTETDTESDTETDTESDTETDTECDVESIPLFEIISSGNPEASNPPPPSPPQPATTTPVFRGIGGGDVHYFIPGAEPVAQTAGVRLVASDRVLDENATNYGSHWAVEWIELENNNINAVLSYREEFGMWPGTTINTRVVTIGSPRILTTSTVPDNDSPALLNNFSINPRNGLPVEFIGGIFLDFIEAAATTQTLMGPNVSFSPGDQWRLPSSVSSQASEELLIAALRSKFNIQNLIACDCAILKSIANNLQSALNGPCINAFLTVLNNPNSTSEMIEAAIVQRNQCVANLRNQRLSSIMTDPSAPETMEAFEEYVAKYGGNTLHNYSDEASKQTQFNEWKIGCGSAPEPLWLKGEICSCDCKKTYYVDNGSIIEDRSFYIQPESKPSTGQSNVFSDQNLNIVVNGKIIERSLITTGQEYKANTSGIPQEEAIAGNLKSKLFFTSSERKRQLLLAQA
jgi:hypothetical protein